MSSHEELQKLRKEYTHGKLSDTDMLKEPLAQFHEWFTHAVTRKVYFPAAMTLSTVTTEGLPDARIVLLKEYDEGGGFTFVTNFSSDKGEQLQNTPYASLLFWWPELERQVRITGPVQKLDDIQADEYFDARPRGAQLAAWASKQSSVVKNREFLDKAMEVLEDKFFSKPVPRPNNWGGYRVLPDKYEFWQGRQNRLHDRFIYAKLKSGKFSMKRLAP